jgi:hypothetical protein
MIGLIGLLLQAPPVPELTTRQRVVAILVAVGMLALVVEMVRRRKLREEYSWLWVITAAVLLVLALCYPLLLWLTQLVGAAAPPSALFFGGLLFVMVLSLTFSVRLSSLTVRTRKLAQRMAMLEEELARTRTPHQPERVRE